MRPRQDLVEIFSTFLQFNADVFNRWVVDPRLQRSMQAYLRQSSQDNSENNPENNSEVFWALYWHRVWQAQTNPLASAHITAYLQEACYWVAKTMTTNLPGKYSVADFFQIAIVRVESILKGFNPKFSSNLRSYAQFAFSSAIKKQLYKQQEADICTDWSLLHKLSQKRLVEALQTAGTNRETIDRYVLGWRCFRELYAPGETQTAHRLTRPNEATWQAITDLYNTERLSQLSSPGAACRPEQLEKWLLTCARAVRSMQFPALVSADAPIAGQESGELLDTLPDTSQDSLLTEAIAQEDAKVRETQITQLKSTVANAIVKLDSQSQELLRLYYQQGLTQQQIAQHLNVKQYTVSRQLSRIRQQLLLALARWSQQTLHISLTSELLESMSNPLEEWLHIHYASPNLIPSQER